MEERQRIMIAPLNWGLGHATRCIPLIQEHIAQGASLTLASDGDALRLLRQEFPQLPYLKLPSYAVSYSRSAKTQLMAMMVQIPKLKGRIAKEKKLLEAYIKEHPQDMIISDNRYGMHHASNHSVIICHQLNLQVGGLSKMANGLHHHLLEQFDECWVPDHEDHRLSGNLSKAELNIPLRFIGPLSRMERKQVEEDIPVMAILSGPEPQRGMLEEQLRPILAEVSGSLLVRGVMMDDSLEKEGACTVIGHLLADELNEKISRARLVICRSGYSSIMDLEQLQKQAILIPTPGQPEQEYLANWHTERGRYRVVRQEELKERLPEMISSAIEKS